MLYLEPSMKGGLNHSQGPLGWEASLQRCLRSGRELQDLTSELHGQRAVPGVRLQPLTAPCICVWREVDSGYIGC